MQRWIHAVAACGGLVWMCMAVAFGQDAEAKPQKLAKQALEVSITAVDGKTGEPVTRLRIVPAPREEFTRQVTWQSSYVKHYTAAPAQFAMDRGWEGMVLRVDADGYLPAVTRTFKPFEGPQEVRLVLEPDTELIGSVLAPDGTPAADAGLAVATWTNEVTVSDGEIKYIGHGEVMRDLVYTDKQGAFRAPGEIDTWVLVVAHESGYADVTAAEFAASPTIRLKAWGRVEGTVALAGKPRPDTLVSIGAGRGSDDVNVHYSTHARTDAQGRFVAERVAPVRQYIQPLLKPDPEAILHLWFSGLTEIEPGKTTHVELPRAGQAMIGKLVLPEDMKQSLADLELDVDVRLRPPSMSGFQAAVKKDWEAYGKFMASDDGRAFQRHNIPVAADGTFRVEGLPESHYVLSAHAYDKHAAKESRLPLASYAQRIQLPAREEGAEVFNVGEVRLKAAERSQ